MILLLGILLWSVVHLYTAVGGAHRQALIARLGHQPYRGLYSLALVGALVLIVMGWRAWPPVSLYVPPVGLRHLTLLLMPLALVLFLAPRLPTDLKRLIRHPQLTGVKLWALAHLLANGESRSLLLFGGLLAWAVVEVILINRRDGAWQKPAPVGVLKTTSSTLFALGVTAALMFAHPWFAGMPVIAMR